MSVKKIKILRISSNGEWDRILLNVVTETNYSRSELQMRNQPDDADDEDEAVSVIINKIVRLFDLEYLRSVVIMAHNHLRENDLSGNSWGSIEFIVVPDDPEAHQSCKENNDNVTTMQTSDENGISQCEVQRKLAHCSNSMKFFEDNKCSVCLSSYKEILDENHHIVVPSCGHPLCCECADNILMSTKKECPRCRGNITADSFNLMKFNADLEMVIQDQQVFL